jgi:hypothetical protein
MLEKVTLPLDSDDVVTALPSITRDALPVGVEVAGATGVTATENLSKVPAAAGLLDEVTRVVPSASVMTTEVAGDVLAPKLDVPLYFTVIQWVPVPNALVMRLTAPWLSVFVASTVLPSLKTTEPLGIAEPVVAFTMACRVTDVVAGAVVGEALTVVEVETAADADPAFTTPAVRAVTTARPAKFRRSFERTVRTRYPPRSGA